MGQSSLPHGMLVTRRSRTWGRADTVSHDLGMQFRAILGCGLLSDQGATSDDTCVGALCCLTHVVEAESVLRK